MPQRKFFVVIGILVFDFELFIGGRRQLVSDIDRYIVTGMLQRKFFMVTEILLFDFELFIGGSLKKGLMTN
jgi:hypothetical protein